jgi:hypothetical protein
MRESRTSGFVAAREVTTPGHTPPLRVMKKRRRSGDQRRFSSTNVVAARYLLPAPISSFSITSARLNEAAFIRGG